MVKELISGILGRKKASQEQAKVKEEVPDELPPLSEDIVKASQKAAMKAEPKAAREVPDELPPLDITPENEPMDHGTLADLEKGYEPDEKHAKAAAGESAKMQEQPDETSEIGFFSSVLEHVKKYGASNERIFSGDLFSRMGSYWELRKHEIKTGKHIPQEKKIEEQLTGKLKELKSLEQKWQVQKLALEEDMRFIHERERDIQSKIEELKLLSNEMGLYRSVKPEEYFRMRNGMVLKSLHDLIDALEIVDDETFSHHAKEKKNDFSDWIIHVFKDSNLADKVKSAKSKMEMIEALEKIPLLETQKTSSPAVTNPRKYFWLSNGTVIRSLYELYDALRFMDDGLFSSHVSKDKNDFAEWARHVLVNNHLADKLSKAKTRKEMAEIVEVFL